MTFRFDMRICNIHLTLVPCLLKLTVYVKGSWRALLYQSCGIKADTLDSIHWTDFPKLEGDSFEKGFFENPAACKDSDSETRKHWLNGCITTQLFTILPVSHSPPISLDPFIGLCWAGMSPFPSHPLWSLCLPATPCRTPFFFFWGKHTEIT